MREFAECARTAGNRAKPGARPALASCLQRAAGRPTATFLPFSTPLDNQGGADSGSPARDDEPRASISRVEHVEQ